MLNQNEKSQTIKIDIRPLGYQHPQDKMRESISSKADYFKALDFRFLFEHAYDAILLTNQDAQILATNPRAIRFFDYSESELIGMSLETLIAGFTSTLMQDICAVIAQGRYMRIQAFASHKNEQFTAVEIVAMGNRQQGDEPICFLVRDIQSGWQAEQKLLSAYHAMDNTLNGIGIANTKGEITYANRTMVKLLADGDEEEIIEQHLNNWFDTNTVIKPMFENISQRKNWSGEQRLLSKGNEKWLMISAVPDINGDDELTGIVFSIYDAAERRQVELAEKQAERSRIIMENMASASHALGQPATVLLSSLEILKLDAGIDAATQREIVDLCYSAALELREKLQAMNHVTQERSTIPLNSKNSDDLEETSQNELKPTSS